MSTDKKERVMTAKGFLFKAGTKAAASADAFIKAHRAWLETGTLAELTGPILAKVDSRELMPTPALEVLKEVVLGHMLASTINNAKIAIAKAENPEEPGEPATSASKPWEATIYDADGNVVFKKHPETGKESALESKFAKPQEADGWVDRRLVEGSEGFFGVVVNHTLQSKEGDSLSRTILRGDAMARTFGARKPNPVCKSNAKASGKLSFGVKSKPSVSKFSHG